MERRKFLKTSCSLCLAVGAGLTISSLVSCSPSSLVFKADVNENKIRIPLSKFAENNFLIVRSEKLEYDISVHREKDNTFTSLYMRCTHAENQLQWTGEGYYCNLHGSKFNSEGSVLKGPAEMSMKKFQTENTNDEIIIRLK